MNKHATNEPVSLLMVEFLTWISSRSRTYAEVMEAWRSTCPRLCVWEDALADRLIQMERGVTLGQSRVTLTARGSAILDGQQQRNQGEATGGAATA
jgi:hypothetical protein